MVDPWKYPVDLADHDIEVFDTAFALPTNSALPPDEVTFRKAIDAVCKNVLGKGKMPFRIDFDCKRSGEQTAKTPKACLIVKAFVKKGFFP